MGAIRIPDELLILHPDMDKRQLRTIIKAFATIRKNRLRNSQVFTMKVPHIGIIRSHGNKRKSGKNRRMSKDRKRKQNKYRQEEFKKEKLLF